MTAQLASSAATEALLPGSTSAVDNLMGNSSPELAALEARLLHSTVSRGKSRAVADLPQPFVVGKGRAQSDLPYQEVVAKVEQFVPTFTDLLPLS